MSRDRGKSGRVVRSLIAVAALALVSVGCKFYAAEGNDYFVEEAYGFLEGAGAGLEICQCVYNLNTTTSEPHSYEFRCTLNDDNNKGPIDIPGPVFFVDDFTNFGGRFQRRQQQTYWLATEKGSNTLYSGVALVDFEIGEIADWGEDDDPAELAAQYVALIIHHARIPPQQAHPVSSLSSPPIEIPEAGYRKAQVFCPIPEGF